MKSKESVSRRSIGLAGALLLALMFSTTGLAAAPAPDLTGVVKSREGKPLADATVFIYTAGPRVGSSPI